MGPPPVSLDMTSKAASSDCVCQAALCSNWAFAGGLCRKHAALKLLSSPDSRTTTQKPTPIQLYRKTVDMPSASRAHYDAVLHRIDRVLSPGHVNFETSSSIPINATSPTATERELEHCKPDSAPPQLSPPLTRSEVAK